MKINHINLTVTDAQTVRHFLEKYFGLKSMEGTTDDATFEIEYPPTFHIGFLQQGKERKNEIYQQLINDGFDVKPPGH